MRNFQRPAQPWSYNLMVGVTTEENVRPRTYFQKMVSLRKFMSTSNLSKMEITMLQVLQNKGVLKDAGHQP